MLLLISDANILIDIEDGHLTPVVFRLPYEIAIPDILFELELRERHSQVQAKGSFDSMKAKGSRLPWGDVEKFLNKWELLGTQKE